MLTFISRPVWPLAVILSSVAGTALAQEQTLDRVSVFNATQAVEMGFDDDTVRNPDFEKYLATSTGIVGCQVNGVVGIICLDGKLLKRWPQPKASTPPEPPAPPAQTLFSCADRAFALDATLTNTCSAMAVDLVGNIWLGGRTKNSNNKLIKVVRKTAATCAAQSPAPGGAGTAWAPLQGVTNTDNSFWQQFCFANFALDRPLILDLEVLDGAVGNNFTFGPGVIALEGSSVVTHYANFAGAVPTVLVTKQLFSLIGNEAVQGATILQLMVGTPTPTPFDFVVATTSTGRVLAREVREAGAPASTTFNTGYSIPAKRVAVPPTAPVCIADPLFEPRASSKTSRVYVTDRAFCQVSALEPDYEPWSPTGFAPSNAFTLDNVLVDGSPFTLSTRSTSGTYPPAGITISPGIDVDLGDCGGTPCTFIADNGDGNAFVGAQLSGVVYTGPGDMTVYQIMDIPDCRVITPVPAICNPGVNDNGINDTTITDGQGRVYLNVSPMLPPEIRALFNGVLGPAPDGLPQMLIKPEHTAIASRGFTFDGFFGVTNPGTRFRETFLAQFDIGQLLGENAPSNCAPENTDPLTTNLNWDLMTAVNERYSTVGGPSEPDILTGAGREHVDMALNIGCFNPGTGAGTRWSLYTYGLQPKNDGQTTYIQWMDRQYNELGATLARLACQAPFNPASQTLAYGTAPVDEVATPPLTTNSCSTLWSNWRNGRDKLNKCIEATTQPKNSALDQNCNSFKQQFESFQATLLAAPVNGDDPANRVGELEARTQVLFFLKDEHALPSVPAGGFQ